MTQQYLVGELSLILGELQSVATNAAAACDVARLRREAETQPIAVLASVAEPALTLTDEWCWESLRRDDPTAFVRQVALFVELWEFANCAGLVEFDYLCS
jgi:hypothetical protein